MVHDVVVVGGGLSGVVCADALAGEGLDVRVVEARERIGGRACTVAVDGHKIDLGGQWIGPGQARVNALVAELGLQTFPTHTAGRSVLLRGARRTTYRGTVPRLGPGQLARLQALLLAARRVEGQLDDPDLVAALDQRTLASWLSPLVGQGEGRDVVEAALATVFGESSAGLSAHWALAYGAAAEGLRSLLDVEGGAQQDRLELGVQGLVDTLAARLPHPVLVSHAVREIVHDDLGVTVRCSGRDLRARFVVLAVPAPLTTRIAFNPNLPATHRRACEVRRMGATIKAVAVYDEAFWREEGLSGEAVFTEGPVQVTFDNTSAGGLPALVAFICGRPALELSGRPEDVEEAVLAAFGRAFGPQARQPSRVLVKDWPAEEWTAGCPVAIAPPGTRQDVALLAKPLGRILWAGTETATDWPGYLEGAIQAGRRAAHDVVVAAG